MLKIFKLKVGERTQIIVGIMGKMIIRMLIYFHKLGQLATLRKQFSIKIISPKGFLQQKKTEIIAHYERLILIIG